MAWWGRALGGTMGFAFGGPIGGILGYVVGGFFDKGLKKNLEEGFSPNDRRQVAFYASTFSVLGYISKIDGYVSPHEIKFAEFVMERMSLREEQREFAIRLFREGKKDNFELMPVLQQFAKECGNRRSVKRMFLEIQISGAMADGKLDDIEIDVLRTIADVLGLRREFPGILESISRGSAGASPGETKSLEEDYQLLGLSEGATSEEVKRAYRRKMSQYHPDKLVAKGLPEEMMDIATEKTKQFRAAYDRIQNNLKARASAH